MKAILSSTSDDIYLYNLPIVAWTWKQLGAEVICFSPRLMGAKEYFVLQTAGIHAPGLRSCGFVCPTDKAATYAQVSRLMGGALYDLPSDELLIVSDIDMICWRPLIDLIEPGRFNIVGTDLVPEKQFPMCFLAARVDQWRDVMKTGGRSYQQCIDDLLGHIECENFRGNQWSFDQDTIFKAIQNSLNIPIWPVERARPGTQFADHRLDRDDQFLLNRLSPDIVDFHLPRPLWTDTNHAILMTVLKYYWPNEDFGWWNNYREQYLKLM